MPLISIKVSVLIIYSQLLAGMLKEIKEASELLKVKKKYFRKICWNYYLIELSWLVQKIYFFLF